MIIIIPQDPCLCKQLVGGVNVKLWLVYVDKAVVHEGMNLLNKP